jgi:hypothetical protein
MGTEQKTPGAGCQSRDFCREKWGSMSAPMFDSQNEQQERDQRASTATDALSSALANCQRELEIRLDGQWSYESLRRPIATFASVAARQEIPPERVLALFKSMVFRLPPVLRRNPEARDEMVSAVVTMAIQAYYSPDD